MGVIKLIFTVLVETILGVAIAAGILAMAVPILVRRGFFAAGGTHGLLLVGLSAILCVAAMILRPGSALRERTKP